MVDGQLGAAPVPLILRDDSGNSEMTALGTRAAAGVGVGVVVPQGVTGWRLARAGATDSYRIAVR